MLILIAAPAGARLRRRRRSRTRAVAAPVLAWPMNANVEGRVVGLDRSASDRPRVLLDGVVIHGLEPARTPARVRISLDPSTPAEVLRPGLRLLGQARLSPPAAPLGAGRVRLPPHGLVRAHRRGRLCPHSVPGDRGLAARRPAPAGVPAAHGLLRAHPGADSGAERRLRGGDPDRRPLRDRPRGRAGAAGLEPLPHRVDLRAAHVAARGGGLRHHPLRPGAGALDSAELAAEEDRRRGRAGGRRGLSGRSPAPTCRRSAPT